MASPSTAVRRPTIHDVARRAGLSYQTVSRVLNSSGAVSAAARAAVEEAIAALDFHPSSAARAFSTGRGNDIAVLGGDLEQYGWASIVAGIQVEARTAGRGVILHEVTDAADALAWLRSQTVFGTISLGSARGGRDVMGRLPLGERVVGVGGRPDRNHAWLSVTERAGAQSAVDHLLALGHATVHHVSTPELRDTDRERGWRAALRRHGRAVPARVDIGSRPDDAHRAGLALGGRDDVTAVLCANDEMAIPLLAGLLDAGARVPEDVSVVGFDDHPLAAYARPALTTVRQDFHELGRRAVALLGHPDGVPEPSDSARLVTELIVRSSSGPSRASTGGGGTRLRSRRTTAPGMA